MTKDRLKYFRVEARELVEALGRGILDLEKAPGDRALVARLLRGAHTLKGAARVVQQAPIGDLAHAAEDALAPHRDEASPPVSRDRVDALLRIVGEMQGALAALRAPPADEGAEQAPQAAPDEAIRTVRVEVEEMDALHDAVVEADVQAADLRRQLVRLADAGQIAHALDDQLAAPRARLEGGDLAAQRLRPVVEELRRALAGAQRALSSGAERLERELGNVRARADRLRLVPAQALFAPLEHAARDAARTLDLSVAFEATGGAVRLDAQVMGAVRDALVHVVRNAVAHGIEPAAERLRRGKAATGRIALQVERRGGRVAFACRDDGAGIDLAAVREAAVRKGLLRPEAAAALDVRGATELLLAGRGLSTSRGVNDVAGRGVGLDAARAVAARLEGRLELASSPGHGTVVELTVPVSLSAISALLVESAGATLAIPLDAVRETFFLPRAGVVRAGAGLAVSHGGMVLPFAELAAALGRPAGAGRRGHLGAVVVESGGRRAALGADRLLGVADVVLRPLPPFVEADAVVAGVSIDAHGVPQLVLDAAGLVAAAARAAGPEAQAAPRRPPVLVIDDSLTTRMLEQSILEAAGYEVALASSAEEALEKARAQRYGLFVVDVEMPGMDGFEFVRTTRADPQLSSVPAILVTSRSAAEDRRRGAEVGASAYVVKGEFDQARLLQHVAELIA